MTNNRRVNKLSKIVGYWALAMLNYRQPKGDRALDKLRELTDADITNAIMMISGFSQGMALSTFLPLRRWQIRRTTKQLQKLAKVVEDETNEIEATQ